MAIPDYQSLMLPLLRLCADGQEHTLRDSIETLAGEFRQTPEERSQLLPSGQQPVFDNRVGWARTYMKKAGLLEAPRRGVVRITERGKQVLASNPTRVDAKFLEQFEEFMAFRVASRRVDDDEPVLAANDETETPEEALASAYQRLRGALAEELLEKVKVCSPAFFERLVVELLVAMGYGGSRKEAGRRVGKSGDGGIDGIINEDRLGLDVVYIQAKRWDGTVSRPEIQKFVGALQGHRARKGVFISTSDFSREALEYAQNLDSKVVLVNGRQLTEYMIDFNVGVATQTVFQVKRIDSDYFAEE